VGPLHRAFDIDAALQMGIKLGPEDIDCEEFHALKTLRSERTQLEMERNRNKPGVSF